MEKQGILTQCHQTFSANYHGLWIISLGWSEILLSTSDFRHHLLGEISLDFFINRGFCCLQQSQYSSIQFFKFLDTLHIHYLVYIYFSIFLFVCFGLPPVNFFGPVQFSPFFPRKYSPVHHCWYFLTFIEFLAFSHQIALGKVFF